MRKIFRNDTFWVEERKLRIDERDPVLELIQRVFPRIPLETGRHC